jgi:hypothetical protein
VLYRRSVILLMLVLITVLTAVDGSEESWRKAAHRPEMLVHAYGETL